MTTGHATVTLNLDFEIEDEEFAREVGNEEGESPTQEDVQNGIREQIEEAVKESSNGSSIQLTFSELNTEVIVRID